MTARSLAVIVALHDGFYGWGTGAGRSNRAFLQVLAALLAPGVRLTVIPVRLVPASSEYDEPWHRESLAIVARAGGAVVPVDNGSAGMTRFGGLDCFRRASAAAACVTESILSGASRALAVAFDAPFYGLAPLLPVGQRARLVNVARATAALHAPADRERAEWERAGLLAAASAGGHVAATSRHMRQHLTSAYAIPGAAITDLVNGLTPAERTPGPKDTAGLLPPAARSGFLLSYGRAEPYKGFDDLLDALAILKADQVPVPHTVLGAVADGPPLTPYQDHLEHRITAERHDVTLLTTFSPAIRGLLADPRLTAVIVPSRAEPFGRIPLEAYAAGASPVVATTAGGLAEIVTEGSTGYAAPPADPRSLAAAIRRALAATPAQRSGLLAAGRHLTAVRYDYQANIAAFLTGLAPWATAAGQST
ncbi:MAG: glycosyltransferase family 4 protein [Trebonia sp.]